MTVRLLVALVAAPMLAAPSFAQDTAPPPFAARGMPAEGQAVFKQLVGTWRVKMEAFGAGGTPAKPVVSTDLIARRQILADGRYLHDIIEGTMGGQRYWRSGMLGYSNIDKRYEWVTQDAMNANMMIYRSAAASRTDFPITVVGTFTDTGFLGEGNVGKPVRQRTVITILGPNEHRFDLYFTPEGGSERLFDRKTFTRAG